HRPPGHAARLHGRRRRAHRHTGGGAESGGHRQGQPGGGRRGRYRRQGVPRKVAHPGGPGQAGAYAFRRRHRRHAPQHANVYRARVALQERARCLVMKPSASGTGRPFVGIGVLVLSSWALSGLDASGKWVMGAGVSLVVLCWVRYVVHLLLVLGLVLPARGAKVLRTKRPGAQITRGGVMLLATLSFFTTLRYLPQAEATAINF